MAHRHLLTVEGLTKQAVEELIEAAFHYRKVGERRVKKAPALRGRTVVTFFAEPSTRTKLSFELAAKRLSADTVSLDGATSAIAKGESLRDTAETIAAMRVDAVVVRHRESGAYRSFVEHGDYSVVNAGDGTHEHPTQALLDAMTLVEHLDDLDGRTIAIVGDVLHSRVARSLIPVLQMLGMDIVLIGPGTMVPNALGSWRCRIERSLDPVLSEVDAVYMLRIQMERIVGACVPSLEEYRERYALTRARLASIRPDSYILHPGPMNRGVEIDGSVLGDERILVRHQVENGIAVRMAVLVNLLGAAEGD